MAKDKHPFVSVIVAVRNEEKYIRECLDGLLRQTVKDFEVLVVIDPTSTDNTTQLARSYSRKRPNIYVLKGTKRGAAAQRNLGVRRARGTCLAFTDGDCVPGKRWLETLVHELEQAPDRVGCVGGVTLVPKSDNAIAQVIGALEGTTLGGGRSAQATPSTRKRYVQSIPNCNALYKRQCWQQEQQDESLIVGQDGEFNYRLSKRGWKFLVIPNAKVWHHRPSTIGKHVRRMYKYGEATAEIMKKHLGILRVRWYALLAVAFCLGTLLALVLSIWYPQLLLILGLGWALYVLALFYPTYQVWSRTKLSASLLTPIILVGQHVSYAFGFLRGLVKR